MNIYFSITSKKEKTKRSSYKSLQQPAKQALTTFLAATLSARPALWRLGITSFIVASSPPVVMPARTNPWSLSRSHYRTKHIKTKHSREREKQGPRRSLASNNHPGILFIVHLYFPSSLVSFPRDIKQDVRVERTKMDVTTRTVWNSSIAKPSPLTHLACPHMYITLNNNPACLTWTLRQLSFSSVTYIFTGCLVSMSHTTIRLC